MALMRVNFRKRYGRDGRRTLPLVLTRLTADQRSSIRQIESRLHDTSHEVACYAEPTARTLALNDIRFGAPNDLVLELHARHDFRTLHTQNASASDEILTRHLIERLQ